jgi:hypothetical protein
MENLRAHTGTPGLQGLIYEMRSEGDRMSLYWADRLEACAQGVEKPVPRTIDERFAFERAWDAKFKQGQQEKNA